MTSDYVHNIVNVFLQSSDEEYADGINWYPNAHALARELSPNDVWRGAGVIAALSPFKQWPVNIRIARESFVSGIAHGNIGIHNAIAQRILDGEHPLDVMRGNKTRNFTMAIATAGKEGIATIDRHAHDVCINKRMTDDTRNINKSTYRAMADAYATAADMADIPVTAMQAICWVVWKRKWGIK